VEIKERAHLDKISDIMGEQMKIEWGSQIVTTFHAVHTGIDTAPILKTAYRRRHGRDIDGSSTRICPEAGKNYSTN
jgi:hypothetical protein